MALLQENGVIESSKNTIGGEDCCLRGKRVFPPFSTAQVLSMPSR